MDILICDDDKNIVIEINKHLNFVAKKNHWTFNIDNFLNGDAILKGKKSYDIAFIDVELAGVSGLAITKHLQLINPHIIIFIVTSFQGYLDDAMDLNVFRYITKPIDKNRFFKSFFIAISLYKQNTDNILIECGDEHVSLLISDILYLTIENRHTCFVTKDNRYISSKKFSYWKDYLKKYNCFSSSHYSYIINLNYVTNLERHNITITYSNSKTLDLPASRNYYQAFKASFYNFMGVTV